jgi:hypothetical protein
MKKYTGIGSRSTPYNIIRLIQEISIKLDKNDFLLRSGGAYGADMAFEINSTKKEIYLPWSGFNGKSHDGISYFDFLECSGWLLADSTVDIFHPNPKKLSKSARMLMARNAMQILGSDCKTPSDFVICWTRDGKDIGGTSQAIRIAKHYNIPVLNLGIPKVERHFINWL